MTKNKKFSIIIITLNEEKNISRSLDNLLNQTYKDFEVIVVDSNSDDKTEDIALSYKNNFKEFRFFNMKKRGVSLWRNTWAKLAKYSDLLFLDADTTFDNDFLEKLNNILFSPKEIIYAWACQISTKKASLLFKIGSSFTNLIMKMTSKFSPTAIWACMYAKKKIFEEVWGFDENINLCEDANFAKKVYDAGYDFYVLHLFFYFDYRRIEKEWLWNMSIKYLRANLHRFVKGEIKDNRYDYKFWHYKK